MYSYVATAYIIMGACTWAFFHISAVMSTYIVLKDFNFV